MSALSHLMPQKIRTKIPFHYTDKTNQYIEAYITVFNPQLTQLEILLNISSEKSQQDSFLTLVKELTDLEIDISEKELSVFEEYFSNTAATLKLELFTILAEVRFYAFKLVDRFLSLEEEKRAFYLAANPEMSKLLQQTKNV